MKNRQVYKDIKNEPKLTIILSSKNGKRSILSTYLTKIKNFGNLSLVKRAKLGQFKSLFIKFYYGRDNDGVIINEMYCKSYEDLICAYKAFSDKTLWL